MHKAKSIYFYLIQKKNKITQGRRSISEVFFKIFYPVFFSSLIFINFYKFF